MEKKKKHADADEENYVNYNSKHSSKGWEYGGGSTSWKLMKISGVWKLLLGKGVRQNLEGGWRVVWKRGGCHNHVEVFSKFLLIQGRKKSLCVYLFFVNK